MTSNQSNTTLERFFCGIAENTFQGQIGIVDPPLIDYISQLMLRFVRSEKIHPIRTVTGKQAVDIGSMISEAKNRLGDARREVHLQIGDFALFWVGLFPESLRRDSPHGNGDQYSDFCIHGKRAYQVASEIETTDDDAPHREILERLSDRFELCAYGMREVRREWENGGDTTSDGGPIIFN